MNMFLKDFMQQNALAVRIAFNCAITQVAFLKIIWMRKMMLWTEVWGNWKGLHRLWKCWSATLATFLFFYIVTVAATIGVHAKVVQVWHANGDLPPVAAALFSWSLCWKLEFTYVMCQLSFLHRISPQFLLYAKPPKFCPFKSILIAHLVTCNKNFAAWWDASCWGNGLVCTTSILGQCASTLYRYWIVFTAVEESKSAAWERAWLDGLQTAAQVGSGQQGSLFIEDALANLRMASDDDGKAGSNKEFLELGWLQEAALVLTPLSLRYMQDVVSLQSGNTLSA